MKRIIGVIFVLLMLVFVVLSPEPEVIYLETEKIPETPHILTHKELSMLYTCREQPIYISSTVIDVDYDEAQIYMAFGRQEGGETLIGQLWAMRTIRNRVESDVFPDNVYDVVSQDKQFEVFANGSYKNAVINAESHIALAMLESGWDETQGALYWRTEDGSENSWHETNLDYITTIEGNRYYK